MRRVYLPLALPGNSAVGVGVGGSLGIYKKSGKATAIYVPPSGSGSDGVQK
jgi:hypothetical protein